METLRRNVTGDTTLVRRCSPDVVGSRATDVRVAGVRVGRVENIGESTERTRKSTAVRATRSVQQHDCAITYQNITVQRYPRPPKARRDSAVAVRAVIPVEQNRPAV